MVKAKLYRICVPANFSFRHRFRHKNWRYSALQRGCCRRLGRGHLLRNCELCTENPDFDANIVKITDMNYSKDGITVATTIDTSHPKLDGTYPVKVRVTYARQRRYYPTGKDLTLDQWNNLSTAKGQRSPLYAKI